MDTHAEFLVQWEELQKERQRMTSEIAELKGAARLLLDKQETRGLFLERKQLEEQAHDLRYQIEFMKMSIERRVSHLSRRRKALTDKPLQREFAARADSSKERLERLIKLNAPQIILENERRLVWEIEADVADVESVFSQENMADEEKMREAKRLWEQARARIDEINGFYRKTKKSLEDAIGQGEQKLIEHRGREIELATESRGRLIWLLEAEPSYRTDAIRRYKARFPADNSLGAEESEPASISINVRRKRRGRIPVVSPDAAEPAADSTAHPWKFFVTFDQEDWGVELPKERNAFLQELTLVLSGKGRHSFDVELVYKKLCMVVEMSAVLRATIRQVVNADPQGWKIVDVGKKRRIFLDIDEHRRIIRFILVPRKEAYERM